MSQQNSSQGRPGSPAGAGAGAGGTGISPIAVCAPAFAPSTGKVAHFREDFTTDFMDFTDRGLFRTAEVSSVKSVISAVQFILVATGRAASFLSFTSHQYPPANQAPSLKNPAKPPFWSRSNKGQSRSIKVNKGE
jgi:hypothetical protein